MWILKKLVIELFNDFAGLFKLNLFKFLISFGNTISFLLFKLKPWFSQYILRLRKFIKFGELLFLFKKGKILLF